MGDSARSERIGLNPYWVVQIDNSGIEHYLTSAWEGVSKIACTNKTRKIFLEHATLDHDPHMQGRVFGKNGEPVGFSEIYNICSKCLNIKTMLELSE